MPHERAFGAAIIAVLIGIVGVFLLLGGLLSLLALAFQTNWGSYLPSAGTFLSFLTSNATIAAAIVLIVGLVYIAVALGLWRQELWALVVVFVFGLLYVIGEGSGLAWGFLYATPRYSLATSGVLGSIVALLIVVGVLAYLTSVRDDFI